jgi:cobalt/nickel transport system permease protein
VTVFVAVALSDLSTYVVTATQFALAVPIADTFFASFTFYGSIYAITQIPLAIGEGILAVLLFDFLVKYKGKLLSSLKVIKLPTLGMEKEVNPQ